MKYIQLFISGLILTLTCVLSATSSLAYAEIDAPSAGICDPAPFIEVFLADSDAALGSFKQAFQVNQCKEQAVASGSGTPLEDVYYAGNATYGSLMEVSSLSMTISDTLESFIDMIPFAATARPYLLSLDIKRVEEVDQKVRDLIRLAYTRCYQNTEEIDQLKAYKDHVHGLLVALRAYPEASLSSAPRISSIYTALEETVISDVAQAQLSKLKPDDTLYDWYEIIESTKACVPREEIELDEMIRRIDTRICELKTLFDKSGKLTKADGEVVTCSVEKVHGKDLSPEEQKKARDAKKLLFSQQLRQRIMEMIFGEFPQCDPANPYKGSVCTLVTAFQDEPEVDTSRGFFIGTVIEEYERQKTLYTEAKNLYSQMLMDNTRFESQQLPDILLQQDIYETGVQSLKRAKNSLPEVVHNVVDLCEKTGKPGICK